MRRILVLSLFPLLAASYYVKIGILSNDPDTDKVKKIWSMAHNYSTIMNLDPVVQVAHWWSGLDAAGVARAVCSLTEAGVDALVFLGPSRWNSMLSSYSDYLGLPFVSALQLNKNTGKHHVTLIPDTSKAAAEFIQHFKWNEFIFIYDNDNGPDQLQEIHRLLLSNGFVSRAEAFLRITDASQAQSYIQLLQPSQNRKILLATSEHLADELASRAPGSSNYHFLLLTPVGVVTRARGQGFYRLTKFSFVSSTEPTLTVLENRWKTLPTYSVRGRLEKDLPDVVILHYDASNILNAMFNQVARENPSILKPRMNMNCLEFLNGSSHVVNYLKKVSVTNAATGNIHFDENGKRTGSTIHIIQTTPFDTQKVGTWSGDSGLRILPEFSTFEEATVPRFSAFKSENPVIVTSILVQPFLYLSEDGSFRGYVVDLLDELFSVIGRQYRIKLVDDGAYGYEKNGRWIGMIGEVIEGKADIAVADLTKTPARGKVVDFSKNFMIAGLNILIKKPEYKSKETMFGPFTFLTVWSAETWLIILLFLALFSGSGYVISRFIGSPDRVRALETKGTDNLSPCGSLWFTIGSLFCRDTGIYPRTVSHRLWAVLWWMFCIFVALAYISALTASLIKSKTTLTTTHTSKTSHEVIKDLLEKGYPDIGTVATGSTTRFFLNSEIGLYRDFGRYLVDNPQVMATSYAEAVKRVRASGGAYAFVMESVRSQLAADSEPCDTLVTAGVLSTHTYAIVMPKNSPLKDSIDHAILSLMERGILRNLFEKWWHNASTSCEDPALNILPKIYSTAMTLQEASGPFYLLILFSLVAVAAAAMEYYFRTRNIVME